MKKHLLSVLLCMCALCIFLSSCAQKPLNEKLPPEQPPAADALSPAAADPQADASAPQPEQDAAWFAQTSAADEWPAFTVSGTSIYQLELNALKAVYGDYRQIYHWMNIGTDYYDIVQFADGSQAAGWVGTDESIHMPDAVYLQPARGADVCGVAFGEDYRTAADRFPRDAAPVLSPVDAHTERLLLGGQIMYMGKYSYLEYTDGIPVKLVVCDETELTFWIEDGKIAAVSYQAPEEAMRLPVTEEEARQRMTISPDRLTDEALKELLLGPEIALANDAFTFASPAELSSRQLFQLFLLWSSNAARDIYRQADGKYHFSADFINGILSGHFRTGSFHFDITQCGSYEPADGTAVIELASGFGGDREMEIADVRQLAGATVQITADFYHSDPFFDGSGGKIRYARKIYTVEVYSTGYLFCSALDAALSEDDLRTALQLHTGEASADLAELFWTYDRKNGYPLGSLPTFDFSSSSVRLLTAAQWDALSLFVYERCARENDWPQAISAAEFRGAAERYFRFFPEEARSSLYLTYQDGSYVRTVFDDGHAERFCYLQQVTCETDGTFTLRFDTLTCRDGLEYDDLPADVRAVYDYAGATELSAAPLRAAVYQAFCDGVIPLDGASEALSVRVRLTGDAIQPFVFVQCRNAFTN